MHTSPLTIVHVGAFMTGLRVGPKHSVQIKLSNGLIRRGHLVLNFADRDVARATALFGSRKFGRRGVNRALIAFCRQHRPDILLMGHADMIDAATVAEVRAVVPGVRVAQWNVDPLFEEDNVRRIRSKLDVVDRTFISTAGKPLEEMRSGGHAMSFLPNPVDLSCETGRADLIRDLPNDLFYACGNPARPLREICGRAWNMDEFIGLIGSRLPSLRMALAGIGGRPHLHGARYQDVLESCAIGLNMSRRADYYLYTSDRIAHLAGNGCVVAIERATGYTDYFSEDEMLFFSSLDELIEKLGRFSAEPATRMRVATAGRARYIARFNEQAVAQFMVDVIMGERAPEDMPW
ncbi:glycosyltransferase family protein [Acetobacter conturbans]|uniref:Glycosyltransferase n=1 Tax=Acetobacter conturbans TaxID=1737472 RepID=A0ABX0K2Z8_9PROT|nr:glycosyltransferase [Acetobacter conturbans]NHN89035.1 glycosyltransferase [Acetobacter conturbans]